jgi:anti-anti-sigma regulatory factor
MVMMATKTVNLGKKLQLRAEAGREPGPAVLHLEGRIDEYCDLGPLLQSKALSHCVLDVSRLTFINSVGVRKWIELMAALAGCRARVTLRGCPPFLVHQMNSIAEVLGTADVESIFAPYECDFCGLEMNHLLDLRTHRDQLLAYTPPRLDCPDCGELMEFGAASDRYLFFLRDLGAPRSETV